MKKIFLISTVIVLTTVLSCATKDSKNEVENYPTYDTTQKTENINDAKSDSSQHGEGGMRHNIEEK